MILKSRPGAAFLVLLFFMAVGAAVFKVGEDPVAGEYSVSDGRGERDLLHGIPRGGRNLKVLENEAFTVGYSESLRSPQWVAYRVTPLPRHRHMERPERFEVDLRTDARIRHSALRGSGFERGHLAPNYVISQLYGGSAQNETFLMTNITPQTTALNRFLWQRLEQLETDQFARWFDELWVITGPIFPKRPERLRSGVAIPTHFFRVFADIDKNGELRTLAFIVPQDVVGDEPLDRYVVTVDEVEARTGLDLFHQLDDEKEAALEAGLPDKDWRLERIRNIPGRYWKSN